MESINFNIVLYRPEIPQNTGNIGRLCVGTNCRLHLVEPLGFDLEEKKVRRAGLDYWSHLDLKVHREWCPSDCTSRRFLFTKKAERSIFDMTFKLDDWFIFGSETKGLPDEMLNEEKDHLVRLPQFGEVRSQNLANTVSAAVYLALKDVVPRVSTDTVE